MTKKNGTVPGGNKIDSVALSEFKRESHSERLAVASSLSTTSRTPRFFLRLHIIVLLAFAAFIVTERLWAFDKPISKDVGAWAVTAHEMLAGRYLYSDLVEMRPPATMVSYAAAEGLIGYRQGTIVLLYVGITVVTLFGIYYAASAGAGGITGGLWAAAFWVVLSNSSEVQGGDPNTEIFINACQIWAFALLIRSTAKSRMLWILAIGVLFVLGSFYKQIAVVAPIFLLAIYVVLPEGGRTRWALVKLVAVISAVGVIAWALLTIYFAATNRFQIFQDLMVSTSLDYAAGRGAITANRPDATSVLLRNLFSPLYHESEFMPDVLNPLALLMAIGIAIGISKNVRLWALLLAFAVAAWVEIALPGQFYPHYYQLLLPPLSVGGGWAIGEVGRVMAGRYLIWLSPALGALILSALLISQLPWYRRDFTQRWETLMTDDMIAAKPLAREINSLLAPHETFYEWGGNPYLYFYTRRNSTTGVLWANFLLGGKLAKQLSQRVVSDLEGARPELVVVAKQSWPGEQIEHPVISWFTAHYDPFPGNSDRRAFRSIYSPGWPPASSAPQWSIPTQQSRIIESRLNKNGVS